MQEKLLILASIAPLSEAFVVPILGQNYCRLLNPLTHLAKSQCYSQAVCSAPLARLTIASLRRNFRNQAFIRIGSLADGILVPLL